MQPQEKQRPSRQLPLAAATETGLLTREKPWPPWAINPTVWRQWLQTQQSRQCSLCQPAGCPASPSPGPSMSRDSTPALPTRQEEDSAPPASDTLGESGAGAELGEDEKKHVDRG